LALSRQFALVCSYAISPGGQSFTTAGGSGTVTVTAPSGRAWSAANTIPFVSFSGASTGSGNGVVNFLVSANAGGELSGTFTVAGLPFTVDQESATLAGLNFIGSMPHIAAEENWTTTFTLVNKGIASRRACVLPAVAHAAVEDGARVADTPAEVADR
jgi:hypothetical protein